MVLENEPSRTWQILWGLNFHPILSNNLFFIIICLSLFFPLVILNQCPKAHFILPGLPNCHPWLNCSEIRKIKILDNIGYGALKNVFKSNWRGHIVALSILKHEKYSDDFNEGLKLLQLLNPNPYIVQLIGFCPYMNIVVTEYHAYNNAINLKYLINDSTSAIKLCLNYAEVLSELHGSYFGKLVNCDSNSLSKLLSQFLVTNNLRMLLADLDSIQKVTNSSVICGSSNITLNNFKNNLFIPPEQIEYGQYNDKSEIWKLPDVCEFFVDSSGYNLLKYELFDIHKSCKNIAPEKRPTAKWLIKKYRLLLKNLS